MTPPSLLLLFLTIWGLTRSEKIVIGHLVESFFAEKFIGQVTVFACWNTFETSEFNRALMYSGMKTGFVPIPNESLDMRRILTVNYYKLGVVLDLDCPESARVLEQFTDQNIPFNESYFWLLVTEKTTPNTSLLSSLPLTIESELAVAVGSVAGDGFELFDAYNPSYRHGGELVMTYMGQWNPQGGLRINLTQYKYQRRNIRGLTLNVSIVINHPPTPDFMTYVTYPINRHLDTMHRHSYALISSLSKHYNFEINLMKTATWGYRINSTTYNGMVGDMIAGIVDIGSTPMLFKPDRVDRVEFTVQTWLARPCFIFRHPKKSTVRNGFLRPFVQEIWVLTALTAVVYWLLLWTTIKIELYFERRIPQGSIDTHPASESGLIVMASLCQQGLSDGPQIYSGRVTFISLFIWGLLLYQFYSASIIGSILGEPARYIKTPEDVLESDLRVGIEDIPYMYDFFATTVDPVALKLYEKKVAPNRSRKKPAFFSAEDGLRRVQKGGFVFHVDVATAYKIIADTFSEDEVCDLVEIQLTFPRHTGITTSKHSPFKKMVTYGMRQAVERGVAYRLRQVWHYRRPECPESHGSIPVPLSLKEFSPALFLLAMGIGLAGFLISTEKCARKKIYGRIRNIGVSIRC